MEITVKLYSVLQLGRFEEKQINYPPQVTVEGVVRDLKLPAEHVDILLVNGVHVKRNHVLLDGDVLSVLPMVEGG